MTKDDFNKVRAALEIGLCNAKACRQITEASFFFKEKAPCIAEAQKMIRDIDDAITLVDAELKKVTLKDELGVSHQRALDAIREALAALQACEKGLQRDPPHH